LPFVGPLCYADVHEHAKIMDRIRRLVGTRSASDSEARTPQGTQVQAAARWRAKTHGAAQGIRGHRVCASDWLPVESAAEGVWEREFGAQVLLVLEAV